MLQIIQYQKNGEISVEDLPDLTCPPNGILVKNYYSLISAGTERTSVETAKASLIGKAKTRPDLVKQVIDNIKKEGFLATYKKVLNRLDNYKELGYSSSGIVIESKTNVFKPGDRVACAGFAYHSELVGIPKNLAVKVPDEVSLREAAFTTIGAIALQGVRQAKVNLGETVVVIGLGLIGLITVQLLKANGCKVIGLDINERNFGLAEGFGCNYCFKLENNFINKIHNLTNGFGADAVIITASTNTSEPMEDAIKIARKKGRIVIVGTLKIVIPRQEFYEKELEITISCSYGPGRYDYNYEIKGLDYPYNYVRWTENRNMEAILELLREKKINFEKLITHEIPIEEGLKAYEIITGKVKEQHIGILIKYNQEKDLSRNYTKENFKVNKTFDSKIVVGFIGAGNFAQSYLLPYLKSKEIELRKVATKTPITAKSVAEKFGFKYYSTSPEEILDDPHINTIFIVTNHSTHGKFVKEALKRNKNVFVEKPLCITEEELMDIKDIYTKSTSKLFVGFNRRFSKQFELIKNFFHNRTEPLFILYRVNAGFIPSDHWIQRVEEGGRLIGEGCHFIDIFDFLIESDIKEFDIKALNNRSDLQIINDNFILTIKYNDGSVATLLYNSNGDRG
ncbi:MAG: bi-domain-containing oxidoreductase, partial [Ignavibacterium sp.]|nr:bi-domain-containing oxidoreductase [Ignavibacterium sp.]